MQLNQLENIREKLIPLHIYAEKGRKEKKKERMKENALMLPTQQTRKSTSKESEEIKNIFKSLRN